MKKFASLLLTVVMLATMLSVFALPASAFTLQTSNSGNTNTNIAGQWIKPDIDPKEEGKMYYGYVIKQGDYGVYDYVVYCVSDDAVALYDNVVRHGNVAQGFTLFGGVSVPQAVRDQAALDYPEVSSTGSVFSDGSLMITLVIIALVVGLGGGFFIGKGKKPMTANGAENTDEE